MLLPEDLARAAARTPIYQARRSQRRVRSRHLDSWPVIDLETLLRPAGRDDPFGGRRDPLRRAKVMLQVGDGLPLYWALGRSDMAGAASALARCWRGLGIGPEDRVVIYDYGTSPLTLFASGSYLPYLRAGAADLIGCTPICNDGLPELASRALHILKYVRPKVVFANGEAMEALLAQATAARSHLDGLTCTIAVSADEQVIRLEQMSRWEQGLGLPVRQLLRADPALFLAAPCAVCAAHHASRGHYLLEVVSEDGHEALPAGEVGLLTVTNLFVKTCPIIRYVTEVRTALLPARGPCAAGNFTIRIAE